MSNSTHTYDDARPGTSPDGVAEASPSAARLLEMTARDTDQWRAEAKAEAEAVVAAARDEAATLVRDAREEAERLRESARSEAAETVNDARVEAYRVREETTGLRKRHDEEIAHLQQVASEHKEQLRRHLTDMLEQVESTPGTSQ
jgi:flagellar biosynthesis/type III secretory pathway protein FliH